MKSAILQSLASGVAVIDRSGRVLQVNDRWRVFARTSDWMDGHAGGNLLEKCAAAFDHGNQLAGDAGRRRVERAWTDRASGSPSSIAPTPVRALNGGRCTAVPLNRPEGGAVLTRANITDLRQAELEAQRSRQELAHVSRVSTVGEMTASLAHQLNQPLTAIMANAQAGARILDAPGARLRRDPRDPPRHRQRRSARQRRHPAAAAIAAQRGRRALARESDGRNSRSRRPGEQRSHHPQGRHLRRCSARSPSSSAAIESSCSR